MTIAANAGIDGALVVEKLIEQEDLSLGYDAAKGLFCLTMNIPKLCGSDKYHILSRTSPLPRYS